MGSQHPRAMHYFVLLIACGSTGYALSWVPARSEDHVHHRRQSGGDNIDPFGDGHKWLHPGPADSRTSCPFLNTAANHGFLPRDGRQISVAQFEAAIVDSLNFAPVFAHTITTGMLTKLGVITNDSATDAALRLDLEQVSKHNFTDHDASITRFDQSMGNPLPVRPSLVAEFLRDTMPMSLDYLNTTSVGRTRARRERESIQAGNPPLSALYKTGAQGEAGLILTIMGDDTGPITAENAETRRAPKDRVREWLIDERFPTALGFKRPNHVVQASENKFVVDSVAKWQARMQDLLSAAELTMKGMGEDATARAKSDGAISRGH